VRNRFALLLVFACLGWTRPGLAYSESLHAFLTGRALAADGAARSARVRPATEQDLVDLRSLFWQTASALPDAALRAEFLARYPDPASFDAWAFKELFMLDPAATVHGFDRAADVARPLPREALRQLASRWPDDDKRNQHRYLRDARRAVVRDARGRPLPDDPATLEMGGLTGTSSQAHAHYGLLPGPLSDDPKVLRTDPRRFAVPPDAHTFGPDFVELYTDLALVARGSGLRGGDFLEQAFAGAAFHHLEDLANQIHTVQVGIYEFFRAAFVQSELRDLVTLGGLFGERRSLRALGLRLVTNHHLLSEDLFAKRVAEAARGEQAPPEVRAAIEGIGAGDPAFEESVSAAVKRGGGAFGRDIAFSLIEASSREGPEVYRLIWRLSAPALRDGAGPEYDGARDDPDRWVLESGPGRAELLASFYELEGRGLRRAGSALRLWQRQFEATAAGDPQAVRTEAVQRALSFLLPYHRAKEQRRAAYAPPPPERSSIDLRWSAGAVLGIGLAVLATRLRRRRRSGGFPVGA
jgi:hypothetical protein